jgi:hypothetical protein
LTRYQLNAQRARQLNGPRGLINSAAYDIGRPYQLGQLAARR